MPIYSTLRWLLLCALISANATLASVPSLEQFEQHRLKTAKQSTRLPTSNRFKQQLLDIHSTIPSPTVQSPTAARTTILNWHHRNIDHQLCPGHYIIPHTLKVSPHIDNTGPIDIYSDGPQSYQAHGMIHLSKQVLVQQQGRIIYADQAEIFRDTKGKIYKITLTGNLRIYQNGIMIAGTQAQLNLHPRTVHIRKMLYHYRRTGATAFDAWGVAASGHQNPQHVITLNHASYTTCAPSTSGWQLSAQKITLDPAHKIGHAEKALLKIGPVPVLWLPYYFFPLTHERLSGFLSPVYGYNLRTGSYFGWPYYWNIAPNFDLVLTPEYYGHRGFRGIFNFRYLSKKSVGHIDLSILPFDGLYRHDKQQQITQIENDPALYPPSTYLPYLNDLRSSGNLRYYFSLRNTTHFDNNTWLQIALNRVSDSYYFHDIASGNAHYADTLTNELVNLIQFKTTSTHWDIDATMRDDQVLHPITLQPYTREDTDPNPILPSIAVYGYQNINPHLTLMINGQYDWRWHTSDWQPNHLTTHRIHLRPGIQAIWQTHHSFLQPELKLDALAYYTPHTPPTQPSLSTHALPIFTIDTGWFFTNRTLSNRYSWTLMPRMFYRFIPVHNSTAKQNIDSMIAPLTFNQLFALNTLQGFDYLPNANQITLALSSFANRKNDGSRIFAAHLGTLIYLSTIRAIHTPNFSFTPKQDMPLVADLSVMPAHRWHIESALHWNIPHHQLENARMDLHYLLDDQHFWGLSYQHLNRPTLLPSAISTLSTGTTNLIGMNYHWPLSIHWSSHANLDYDLQFHRINHLDLGLTYHACCWSLRFTINQLFSGSTSNALGYLKNHYNTGYFVALELKGLTGFSHH